MVPPKSLHAGCLAVFLLCLAGFFLAWPHPSASARQAPASPPLLPPLDSFFPESGPFTRAMEETAEISPSPAPVTGLVAPHGEAALPHVAKAFSLLGQYEYKRVIILADTPEGEGHSLVLPRRDMRHCLGLIELDAKGRAALARALPAVRPSGRKSAGRDASPSEEETRAAEDRFALSSPVQTLLPFIDRHIPDVPVLPLGVPLSSTPAQWKQALHALRPLCGPGTLLVYAISLPPEADAGAALRRDQTFLRLLSSGSPEYVRQPEVWPDFSPSGGMYLMRALQHKPGRSRFTALEHAASPVPGDPAFIVGAYAPLDLPVFDPAIRYFAAGDFFTGRRMAPLLANPGRKALLVGRILERTRGCPLLVNFEGVLMDPQSGDPLSRDGKGPLPGSGMRLWMPKDSTLALLKELNVIAVSLANNHTYDFGTQAYHDTQAALEEAGIAAPGQGEIRELEHFTLAAFTDLCNSRSPYAPILLESDLAALPGRVPHKPLFAMVHLGNEYTAKPNIHARNVGAMLARAGVEALIGHHPHVSNPLEVRPEGYFAWTLGNFVFDQVRRETAGALLEIVFFKTGAYWARQLPPENMFREFHQR